MCPLAKLSLQCRCFIIESYGQEEQREQLKTIVQNYVDCGNVLSTGTEDLWDMRDWTKRLSLTQVTHLCSAPVVSHVLHERHSTSGLAPPHFHIAREHHAT